VFAPFDHFGILTVKDETVDVIKKNNARDERKEGFDQARSGHYSFL
jgi:hypothetical protein